MIFLIPLYISVLLYFATKSPDSLISKPITIITLIFIPVLLLSFFHFSEIMVNHKIIASIIILGITGFIGIVLYYYNSSPRKNIMTQSISYMSIFIIFLIFLFALTIFYNMFMNNAKKNHGWTGFFTNLLFYLPCLISDYFKYLFNEYYNTPSVVFILFIIEISLLLLYVYLPFIIHAIFIPSGITLLNNPSYLNPSNAISTGDTFLVDIPYSKQMTNSTTPSKTYNSQFSLSMWIFVNNTILGTNEQESIIFKYANPNDFYGKPCISYLGNDNWRFIFSNNPGNTNGKDLQYVPLPEYIMKMPSQKWHNIVFTYYENKVDLFINGSLARSMELTNRLPIKDTNDSIIIGSDSSHSIPGAICNINYYKTPLTSAQISRIYNLLFKFNPPVNNLQ
jgi:hypothetical protein